MWTRENRVYDLHLPLDTLLMVVPSESSPTVPASSSSWTVWWMSQRFWVGFSGSVTNMEALVIQHLLTHSIHVIQTM